MTNAEVKVKEVADVVREKINQWKNVGTPREVILERVDAYLSGLSDGIEFCDDMRRIQEAVPAPKEITKARIYPDIPDCPQKQPTIPGEEN